MVKYGEYMGNNMWDNMVKHEEYMGHIGGHFNGMIHSINGVGYVCTNKAPHL